MMTDEQAITAFQKALKKLNDAKSLSHITNILLSAGITYGRCSHAKECPVAKYLSEKTMWSEVRVKIGVSRLYMRTIPQTMLTMANSDMLGAWIYTFDSIGTGRVDHVGR